MADYHDDSHILSKLGILESKEESPKKLKVVRSEVSTTSERDRFVEVDIGSDSESDDAIFDKDTLLSSSNLRSTRPSAADSVPCRFLLLLSVYFVLGVSCVPSLAFSFSSHQSSLTPIWSSVGLIFGILLARWLLYRINSLLLSLVMMSIATMYYTFTFTNVRTIELHPLSKDFHGFILSAVVGTMLFVGITVWFALFRQHKTRLLILYTVLSLGCVISMSVHNTKVIPNTLSSVRVVRSPLNSETGFSNAEDALDNVNSSFSTISSLPKKPVVAQGIQEVDTKANRNALNRNAHSAERNSSGNVDASNTSTMSSTISSLAPTTSGFLTTSVFNNRRRVLEYQSTSDVYGSHRVDEVTAVSKGSSAVDESSSIPHLLALVCLGVVVAAHLLSYCMCCVNFSFGVDSRILKLSDPSVVGFTRGCKVRIFLFHILTGIIEILVISLLSTLPSEDVTIAFGVAFLSRLLLTFFGPISYSSKSLWLFFYGGYIATLLFVTSLAVKIGLYGSLCVASTLPLLLTLHIENTLAPRASILVDFYLIPNAVGQLMGSLLCLFIHTYIVATLIVIFTAAAILFPFVRRSIKKSVRLKEVMEYSMEHSQETVAGYLSLIQHPSDTDDEDDIIEMDDL